MAWLTASSSTAAILIGRKDGAGSVPGSMPASRDPPAPAWPGIPPVGPGRRSHRSGREQSRQSARRWLCGWISFFMAVSMDSILERVRPAARRAGTVGLDLRHPRLVEVRPGPADPRATAAPAERLVRRLLLVEIPAAGYPWHRRSAGPFLRWYSGTSRPGTAGRS